jgi:hypothetical protein
MTKTRKNVKTGTNELQSQAGRAPPPDFMAAFGAAVKALGLADLDKLLVEACEQGNAARVGALVAAGADIHQEGGRYPSSTRKAQRQYRPLVEAAYSGSEEAVEILLRAGADPDAGHPGHALVRCTYHGNANAVRAILERSRCDDLARGNPLLLCLRSAAGDADTATAEALLRDFNRRGAIVVGLDNYSRGPIVDRGDGYPSSERHVRHMDRADAIRLMIQTCRSANYLRDFEKEDPGPEGKARAAAWKAKQTAFLLWAKKELRTPRHRTVRTPAP